jgi:hypothetical protein
MISASEWRDDFQRWDDASMPDTPTTVTILGGDPSIVGALGLLLQGVGYDVRFLTHPVNGNLGELLSGVRLVLLGPTPDPGERANSLSVIKRTPSLAALPVVALISDLEEAPQGDGLAAYVPWPCRTSELVEQIEAVL